MADRINTIDKDMVAPFTGAWIEMALGGML